MMEAAWFVLRTAPRMELAVKEALWMRGRRIETGRDVEPYLPMETRLRKHFHGERKVSSPLIPGYLFVGLRPDARGDLPFWRVHEIEGALDFLRADGAPFEVDYGEVRRLMDRQILGEFDYTQKRKVVYRPGEPVRIVHGPLTGWLAEVLACDDAAQRAEIMVKGLGGGRLHVGLERIEHAA